MTEQDYEYEAKNVNGCIDCYELENGTRLNKCKAAWYIWNRKDGKYVILRSYNTNVAFIQVSTQTLYIRGYFSHTTVQHICKFRQEFRYIIARTVNLNAIRWYKNDVDYPLYPMIYDKDSNGLYHYRFVR